MRAEQFLYVNYVLQYVNGHAEENAPNFRNNLKFSPNACKCYRISSD